MSEITVTLSLLFIGVIILFFGIGFILSRFTKSEVSFKQENPEKDLSRSTILDPQNNLQAIASDYNYYENVSEEDNYSNESDDRYAEYLYTSTPVVTYAPVRVRKSPVILNPRLNNTRVLFH